MTSINRLRVAALLPLLVATLLVQVLTSSLASCATATATQGTGETPMRIFLVAGQSNAEGADANGNEIDDYPPFVGVGAPQTDAMIWYELGAAGGETSNGWIPMQPALQSKKLGPEVTFARKVAAETGDRVGVVKSAKGGTNLAVDWDPDSTSGVQMYSRTIALMQTALADLTSNGVAWELSGLVWQQGENDMLDDNFVAQYGPRLTALIARFRTDLNAPNLPVFVGGTSFKCIWGLDYADNMRQLLEQQLSATDADPLAYFVESSHLAFKINTDNAPHYHFGTEGQLQLGEAHADAYLTTIGFDLAHVSEPFANGLPAEKGDTVRVFVMAGQRSMEGEGAYVSEIANYPRFAGLDQPQQDVLYRYRLGGGVHTSTDWAPLAPVDYLHNYGPELSFGHAADRLLDDPVAVIKLTDSAAFLVDWVPTHPNASRPQYDAAVRFVRQSLADLTSRGFAPVLEGVLWLPGEHDAWWTPHRNQYASNLTNLVSSLRTDLGAPNLKWFVAELRNDLLWGDSNLDELDAKIASVAAADPLLWFVKTGSLTPHPPAPTFGPEGSLQLGRLFAQAYERTLP